MFRLWINQVVGFYYQHVWKTPVKKQVLFKIFGRKNQLPGFYISRTLVENGLSKLIDFYSTWNYQKTYGFLYWYQRK